MHYKLENADGVFVYKGIEFSQLREDVLDDYYDRDSTHSYSRLYSSTWVIKSEAVQATLLKVIYA